MVVLTLHPLEAENEGEHKPCNWAPPCWTQGKSNCSIPNSILIHVFLWQWLPCWKSCSPAMLPSQLAAYLVFRCVGLSFSHRAAAAAVAPAAAAPPPSLSPSPPAIAQTHCTVRGKQQCHYNRYTCIMYSTVVESYLLLYSVLYWVFPIV